MHNGLSILLFSCNSEIGKNIRIMNDVRSEFNVNSIEMSWNNNEINFNLQDISYDELTTESLKSLSKKMDKYLSKKYINIDTTPIKKYKFSSIGKFEIIEITINQNNEIVNVKNPK